MKPTELKETNHYSLEKKYLRAKPSHIPGKQSESRNYLRATKLNHVNCGLSPTTSVPGRKNISRGWVGAKKTSWIDLFSKVYINFKHLIKKDLNLPFFKATFGFIEFAAFWGSQQELVAWKIWMFNYIMNLIVHVHSLMVLPAPMNWQ